MLSVYFWNSGVLLTDEQDDIDDMEKPYCPKQVNLRP